MEFIRYENQNMIRIEKLLEKLLLKFEGKPEEKEIVKCLESIEENKNENNIGGWNFI
jgi:hypothetical protein